MDLGKLATRVSCTAMLFTRYIYIYIESRVRFWLKGYIYSLIIYCSVFFDLDLWFSLHPACSIYLKLVYTQENMKQWKSSASWRKNTLCKELASWIISFMFNMFTFLYIIYSYGYIGVYICIINWFTINIMWARSNWILQERHDHLSWWSTVVEHACQAHQC